MNNAQSINEVPWHLVCMPQRWEMLMCALENLHAENLRGKRMPRIVDTGNEMIKSSKNLICAECKKLLQKDGKMLQLFHFFEFARGEYGNEKFSFCTTQCRKKYFTRRR